MGIRNAGLICSQVWSRAPCLPIKLGHRCFECLVEAHTGTSRESYRGLSSSFMLWVQAPLTKKSAERRDRNSLHRATRRCLGWQKICSCPHPRRPISSHRGDGWFAFRTRSTHSPCFLFSFILFHIRRFGLLAGRGAEWFRRALLNPALRARYARRPA